jgi:Tat protein secretion system quality control protein TatD with DNase activity
MLVWFSDVERQSSLLELCKSCPGQCYAAVGIIPDNIDRSNKKMHSSWLSKIEELALSPECVAIISGLNLTREMGTHFAQESLLKSCARIADRFALPLILHVGCDGASLDRALEFLHEIDWLSEGQSPNRPTVLYDALSACGGDPLKVRKLTQSGIRCMVSAAGLTDPNEAIQAAFRACLNAVPLSQMMACTDSPWKTPQNLLEPFLRTLRNEPRNLSAVVDVISSGISLPKESVSSALFQNTLQLLQIPASPAGAESSATELHPPQQMADPSPEITNAESTKSLPQARSAKYRCAKCRRLIVTSTRIVTHSVGASRSVFKIGQEGLCSSSIFVSFEGDDLPAGDGDGYVTDFETVHCAGCRAKIGRVSFGDATCGCGTVVSGPVLRLTASKLDQLFLETDAMDTSQLSAILSRLEDQQQLAEGDDAEGQHGHKSKSKKKKKKPKQRSENKGNFSSYRNKSFVPNASRKKKKESPASEDGKGPVEVAEEDSDDEPEEAAEVSGPRREFHLTAVAEEEQEGLDEESEEDEQEA